MAGWFHVFPLNTLRVSSRESMETGITNSAHDQNDQHKMRTRPHAPARQRTLASTAPPME